ncbi:MAG: hypothetical protein V4668_01320 [Patescibacteria group bacterium]
MRVKEPVRIPSPEEVGGLEKGPLTQILEEVCMRLWKLMTPMEYETFVIRRVRTVTQGLKAFREYVIFTIQLLEKKSSTRAMSS